MRQPTRPMMPKAWPTEQEWADRAKRLVKAELKRAGITYDELAHRFTAQGMPETRASIASKLSRERFAATFFLAALKAIDCQTVRLDEF